MFYIVTASADSYITNKIISNKFRATDANVGRAGTLDLFKLYDESSFIESSTRVTSSVSELTRLLLKFDYSNIVPLTSSSLDINNNSFKAMLRLSEVQTGAPVPRNFSVGTNNETFTVRNETASSDALTISNANNATFAGNVGVAGKTPTHGLTLAQGTGVGNKIAWSDSTPDFAASIYASNSTDKLTFATKNASNVETTALEIDTSQNATFAGNVTVNGGQILTPGGVNIALNPNTGTVTVGGIIQCSGAGASTFTGNVGIGTTSPQSKLQVAGGIQMADDTATASASKVGTMRYRTGTEYVDVTGTNLISNPDFTTDTVWTKETGWTITGGELVATAAAGNTACYQVPSLTNGSIYRCTFTISEYTSGKVSFRAGTAAANTFFDAVGTYSVIMTAGGALQGRFGLESGVTTTLKISQCSIVEVTAEDASYADMCMQTGASTYEWVNMVRNTY